MTNQLANRPDGADVLESVVIGGDLSKLTPEQRVQYYQRVCHSLNLNPLTRPFDYIMLNGKLTLYARKDATEQLRKNHEVSIDKPDIHFEDDWIIVTVVARNASGRTDSDIGVVNRKDMQNNFGNALMKAVTKAKRRVTLSICGLGMLDETEIETIPQARPVAVADTGEIVEGEIRQSAAAEVTQGQPEQQPAGNGNGKKSAGGGKSWPAKVISAVIAAELAENPPHAVNRLNLSNLDPKAVTEDQAVTWMRAYDGWRAIGAKESQAAEYANNGEAPK